MHPISCHHDLENHGMVKNIKTLSHTQNQNNLIALSQETYSSYGDHVPYF